MDEEGFYPADGASRSKRARGAAEKIRRRAWDTDEIAGRRGQAVKFIGYENTRERRAKVLAILDEDGKPRRCA